MLNKPELKTFFTVYQKYTQAEVLSINPFALTKNFVFYSLSLRSAEKKMFLISISKTTRSSGGSHVGRGICYIKDVL